MARPREPVELIKAKGRKHLTNAEYEERKNGEIVVPFKEITMPECLITDKQKEEFWFYADKLLELGIFTELDVDCLARYILAHSLYLEYTAILNERISSADISVMKEVQTMQDKVFRQAQTAAKDLGLTVTSRAKLVIPQALLSEDDEL